MANPHPSPPPEGRRFSPDNQPIDRGGRTPTKFLRDILSKPISSVEAAADFRRVAKLEGGEEVRAAFVHRLIQIAFTDRVIVVGHNRATDTPVERVSSKESIEAIKVLQSYDQGKPVEAIEHTSPDGSMSPAGARPDAILAALQAAIAAKKASDTAPAEGEDVGSTPG
jgi:hypothetical protein